MHKTTNEIPERSHGDSKMVQKSKSKNKNMNNLQIVEKMRSKSPSHLLRKQKRYIATDLFFERIESNKCCKCQTEKKKKTYTILI
jgi:hypothetical protein